MKNTITIDPEQLQSLLSIYRDRAGANDIETTRVIFNSCFQQRLSEWGAADIGFARCSALGAVLRVGYILGIRAERRHRQLQTDNNAAHYGGKHND